MIKAIFGIFIFSSLIVVENHQRNKSSAQSPPVYKDTPTVRYHRFLTMHIDTIEYGKYIDTMVICNNMLGRALIFDDAIFWKQAHARAFARINSRIYKDSTKLPEPQKPKK